MQLKSDGEIADLLSKVRTIAMVGASNKPDRPSFGVMRTLQAHGYRVIPVNPALAGQSLHGETVMASLADILEPVDMVDIFRRADEVEPIVDAAVAIGAKAVWMQLGVISDAAAARAVAAGLAVVMDHCPAIELSRLNVAPVSG